MSAENPRDEYDRLCDELLEMKHRLGEKAVEDPEWDVKSTRIDELETTLDLVNDPGPAD